MFESLSNQETVFGFYFLCYNSQAIDDLEDKVDHVPNIWSL